MGSRDQTRSSTGVVRTLNCGACSLAPHSVCVRDVSPKYFLTLIFILYATTVSVVYRPLDFVGTFSNRWSYGVAFGATANKVMFLFSEGYQPLEVPQWAQGTRSTSHILGMSPGHTCSQRPRELSKRDKFCEQPHSSWPVAYPKSMFSSPQRFPACLGSFPQIDSDVLWTKITKAQEVASSLSSPLSLLPSNRHSFWGFSSRKDASLFGH